MPPVRAVLLATAVVALLAGTAFGADWGLIVPGESTQDAVRARYGAPTRTVNQRVDGYQTVQWVYEGAQAPAGLARMTIDFGLARPSGYQPQVVRTLKLEPKPGAFPKDVIMNGWGPPARFGDEGGAPVYFYNEGLVVYFDKAGLMATLMVFLPPQPVTAAPPAR